MTRPRDIADLYLAPVALAIEAELGTLTDLTHHQLLGYIALTTNHQPRSVEERRVDFVDAVTFHLDLHGWRVTVHPRGLQLANGEHTLVLGLPSTVASYLCLAEMEAVGVR
jgi:hypothetical protein